MKTAYTMGEKGCITLQKFPYAYAGPYAIEESLKSLWTYWKGLSRWWGSRPRVCHMCCPIPYKSLPSRKKLMNNGTG
jgi:hypothetical protein